MRKSDEIFIGGKSWHGNNAWHNSRGSKLDQQICQKSGTTNVATE